MSYQEFSPSPLLQDYIDTFWISQDENHLATFRILPDGFIDIVFDLEGSQTFSNSSIRVVGMMTAYKDVDYRNISKKLGIRFKAGQLNAFTKLPAFLLKNIAVSASEIHPEFNTILLEKLITLENWSDQKKMLENLLVELLKQINAPMDSLLSSVCNTISHNYRAIDLTQIAYDHNISLRQLERRFKNRVGITMKEYHSIIRFKKASRSLSNTTNRSLLLTAFDHGYFDHAHLTRDFNKMSGLNPSQF